ncbi:MAG: TetR family transcriptional regulator [Xanthomonadaceae bacterium]|nr:TetR family transcriptional regulator [Xanthomonadaceae bacterium]
MISKGKFMAGVQVRNAEATKERILEAAMAEFSSYGIAGARVDRIAKTAGCNKNLIYIYFENKETLFTTVLSHYLVPAYDDLAFTPDDLGGYAGRVFDFSMAHPALMRLLAWFSLEQKTNSPEERSSSHAAKVLALSKAREAGYVGNAFPPEFLLTVVMTLATAWTAANPFGLSLEPDAIQDRDKLKKRIAAAVRLIASAQDVLD